MKVFKLPLISGLMVVVVAILGCVPSLQSFTPPLSTLNRNVRIERPRVIVYSESAKKSRSGKSGVRVNKTLLDEFKTATGEIIEPYSILKVSREASRDEIKQAYRKLSRKYHPDGARFRKLLPGNCNNLEDVRDEWERIKLSYEILSDKKMRARYDRNSNLSDPKAALGRAAMSSVGWGIAGVGKGIFKMGEFAFSKMASKDVDEH